MRHLAGIVLMGSAMLMSGGAAAESQTVKLKVGNLFCATCPYIVQKTLANVKGVSEVKVSFRDKTAVVTYDDRATDPSRLVAATSSMGFPSEVME